MENSNYEVESTAIQVNCLEELTRVVIVYLLKE